MKESKTKWQSHQLVKIVYIKIIHILNNLWDTWVLSKQGEMMSVFKDNDSFYSLKPMIYIKLNKTKKNYKKFIYFASRELYK